MLWYLLYPLRGTTEAPALAPTHPLRRAFTRYGTWTARHVKIVLPLSGAVVFLFLYLFPSLYTTDVTSVASGVSYLPHHVWTDAQPLSDQAGLEPDVIMRSIWVHGSYMKALQHDVLLGALELQDEILGSTVDFNPRQPYGPRALPDLDADLDRQERDAFHIVNGLTNQSWFFHSPLQYWSGSADKIVADPDIVGTVNERKRQTTSVNTTLRHSIVFSGKRFEERQLVAADALVITLIHLHDSPVGRQWMRKAEALAQAAEHDGKWQIIPPDGKSISNQLYEFQFQPMSWSEWAILTLAYLLALSYLLLSMSRLRAVKSRLGLMVTIVTQITASIVSSFTVCAIFKVDLSRIPYYAYLLVILVLSMENSFRLINTVIMTSSTISNSNRIGEAFGTTAHIAVANRVQNFLILILLSRMTYSGVSAFCTFAAIATLFDFFYLATFFLSVLSIDVRQRELYELEKSSLKRAKPPNGELPRQPWINTMFPIRLGETALSTRIAGTIVLIGFVLIAQAHYVSEGPRQWLHQLVSWSWRAATGTPKSTLLVDIHQARSPTSWLRLQDHETAREVIRVVKPRAHSYVARVYDPLVFVLKGSDRTPDTSEPLFLPALYDFLHRQIPQFVVWLFTVLAALRLFTEYLIKDQSKDGPGDHPDDEPLLSVRTMSKGHTLDVAMLAASPGGQLVSVGLDRAIQVWDVPAGSRSRVLSDPEVPLENPFPVLSMAMDDGGKWLALVSWQRVFLWSLEEQQWTGTRDIDLGGHRPEAAFFITRMPDATPSLVLVRRNGIGLEIQLESQEIRDFVICRTPLVWAVSFTEQRQQTLSVSILTASRKNCIHLVRQRGNEWSSTEVKLEGEKQAKDIHCLLPVPAISMYLIGRSQSVDLVDLDSSIIVHTFRTEMMQPRTLKHICVTRPQKRGLASLILSYTSAETGDLVVHSYLPEAEADTLTSFTPVSPGSSTCSQWSRAKETIKHIANPGVWEALPSGSIVGVRRKQKQPPSSPTVASFAFGGLRRRTASSSPSSYSTSQTNSSPSREWEAWVLNRPDTKSDFETRPLDEPEPDVKTSPGLGQYHRHRQNLMISELGPMVRLGTMSVAVGFGDVVKVVSVGHEHFDKSLEGSLGLGLGLGLGIGPELQVMGVGSRRKKVSGASMGRVAGGGGSSGT
ncbi:sterol regulatory element-binding protein cleavage-activating protein [Achaetomium macrosporum]|uniref:Sterol regulatory element-binding protein cleavage-activating protein n=1 Tax=Achaetomium macrosporum TaxID=79813 RepID=A0AAN7HBN3_9PEZI|nr:sterol regulatory element-binding protein cleavage-activating protein [Achaetomium macrosporum]